MQVLKFGGASVATPSSFLKIADLIIERVKVDPKVVVVVSAMANQTDHFFKLASEIHPNPPKRELDMLLSVGERISISLLAMALSLKGYEAVSFTGSQSGIITNDCHSDARIVEVKPIRLFPILESKKIAIVAGFQGVSKKGEITTLGRGGSDTTAVALAVALRAPIVHFYKDVEGIYDHDPKIHKSAKQFTNLSYKDALDLSLRGAKVIHSRCIELAEKNGIGISIKSFENPVRKGTFIGKGKFQHSTLLYEDVDAKDSCMEDLK